MCENATASDWVSVEDRLPNENGWYWVKIQGYSDFIMCLNFQADADFQLQRIQEWSGPIPKPLPSPPEKV